MIRSVRRECFLLCLLLYFLSSVSLGAEQNPQQPEPLTIPGVEGKIAVNGKLDEAAWQQALVLDLPYETDPGRKHPRPGANNGADFLR